MRILQLLPPRPGEYEKKHQRIDFELLQREQLQSDVTLDYRKPPVSELPEAVEQRYWSGAPRSGAPCSGAPPSGAPPSGAPRPSAAAAEGGDSPAAEGGGSPQVIARRHTPAEEPSFGAGARVAHPAGEDARRHTVASFRRKSIISLVEQTMVRLHRTREDIEWLLLDDPPSDFTPFDAWIDPAVDDDDRDGFVAEALVCGKVVVATRIPINVKRLEKGRTGILVPPHDANELTHAILAALFKPEVAQQKLEAAQQTISKFHPRQRLRALLPLLER